MQLKRQLREMRQLAERGNVFELKGREVVSLEVTTTTIEARLATRPQRTPEWVFHTLKNSAEVRRFVDTVKAQLARWDDE